MPRREGRGPERRAEDEGTRQLREAAATADEDPFRPTLELPRALRPHEKLLAQGPRALTQGERRVSVVTTHNADVNRVKEIQDQAGDVLFAGETRITGEGLVESLAQAGYQVICNTTGPKVLHLLVVAGVLDRLYLTTTSRVLGGSPYSSIVEGDLLESPLDFKLNALYYDPQGLDGLGQLFSSYNKV